VDALDFMPHLRSAAEYILSSSFLPYCLWSLLCSEDKKKSDGWTR
jgi:hypothetical protein